VLRNIFEWLLGGWFASTRHTAERGKRLARFVAVHEVTEAEHAGIATPTFAVMIALGGDSVILVFNRYRKLWELPGGLIDAGETPRDAATRELREESGCTASNVRWLGLVEVDDGQTHCGAIFCCDVTDVPPEFQSDEISALGRWRRGEHPRPLGESDAALLNRFGAALAQ
jgi:8-oxo-dGTP diphosphatase